MQSLYRLLRAIHDPNRPEIPAYFSRERTESFFEYAFRFRNPAELEKFHWHLLRFLNGNSTKILEFLQEKINEKPASAFFLHLVSLEIESLESFYKYGPRRNRLILRLKKAKRPLIPQHRLDDYLVELRFSKV